MTTVAQKLCPLCTFEAPAVTILLSHLRTVHFSDPRFRVTCGLDGCLTTSRSFSALYSHIYRHHPHIVKKRKESFPASSQTEYEASGTIPSRSRLDTGSDLDLMTDSPDIQYLMGLDVEQVRRSSALFLLKLKEQRRTSQVAIDDIVEGCKGLFTQTIDRVQAGVRAKLAELGLDPDTIEGLDDIFKNVTDPFEGIETCHLQEKYFRETLGLIEPQEIQVGEPVYRPQFSGAKRRLTEKWDTYQYVPLIPSLSKLLRDDTVLEQIDTCPQRIHADGLIEDFCDGALFTHHPLFSQDPYALQFVAYYDEVEICNPLGAHVKKHKLGIVFYTLANIAPKFRSQLKLINLAIVATVPIIEKYGLDYVLKPFIADLNTLATTGISVSVHGMPRQFKGALLAFLADNLAANDLGGFKKSFSFSFRCCRTCLVTRDTLTSSFNSSSFELRTEDKHREQCQNLDSPAASHYSKTYGINRKTSLLDIRYFSMFGGGLPHDAMHDILEGIGPLEIKLLLSHCITNGLFTLEDFNHRLMNFNYGYSETDKPVPVLARALRSDGSVRSSASQMSLLLRTLPFLVGDKVPQDDEHWLCFLLLRKIVGIVLSPVFSEGLCSLLKLLIAEHHSKFVSLYGVEACIPKMHFLVHYPDQIQAVAPMVRTWTIRHEAKLNFFKQASHLANFKNVAFALANRHQRWMCYEQSSGKLIDTSIECGPSAEGFGVTCVRDESRDIQDSLFGLLPDLSLEATVFHPTWVRRNGILFQSNNAYLITGSDGLDPVFSRLDDLMVIGGDIIIFIVSMCKVLYFDSHYHAYVINVTSHRSLHSNLVDHAVHHAHKLADGFIYISLKHHFL